MLNYKKPIKVKSKLMENEQVTIAPADTKTQVIKAGNKTIGTVSNPTVANQLKTAIQKGEVNLAQDLKESNNKWVLFMVMPPKHKVLVAGFPMDTQDEAIRFKKTQRNPNDWQVMPSTDFKSLLKSKYIDFDIEYPVKGGREVTDVADYLDSTAITESAPKDQEQWIKDNKDKFIKQYGKKGEAILYATAWQRHNKGVKESKINEGKYSLDRMTFNALKDAALAVMKKYKVKGKVVRDSTGISACVLSGPFDILKEYFDSERYLLDRTYANANSPQEIGPFSYDTLYISPFYTELSPTPRAFFKELTETISSKKTVKHSDISTLSETNYLATIEIGDVEAGKPYVCTNKVAESNQSELDKLFESVAFDEPDPVSHILSKFKFEVNQFCQGQQINPDLYDCLYDYYLDAGLMPYGVAKARDANPIEWVSSKLKEYLGQCGVSQQTSQPVESPIEVQNEQPVPEYGDDVEQPESPEAGVDDLLEASKQDDAFRLVRDACNDVLVRGGWLGYAKETDRSGLQSVRFSTKDGNGFVTVFETPNKTTIVANGKKFKTAGIKFTYRVNDKTKQSGDIVDVGKFKQVLQTIVTDAKELTEQEIDQMFESILGKPLTSNIKESKMKVTQPKRKQVAESSIDRKSKLMEAVDPKSVYIVVKNVPRLRGIKCDIGITYELSYDPDDDVFSAVAVKFVDMETGQKYAQTQFQDLAYKQLMLFADKDATKRANDNDLEPQDFTESGRQKPIVKEILKASKTVTRDFFANVSESSIDRKARQLVDSWNLKLKQKLKESSEEQYVVLQNKADKTKFLKWFDFDAASNKYKLTWTAEQPKGYKFQKNKLATKSFRDKCKRLNKIEFIETDYVRPLNEGVSISTSQSQGFGYDEIDGNTSINVCATGEDAIRLAEILRDAGFGQFKLDHIAVPQKAIVGDYHDDAVEVKQPEYDPMPEYDEDQIDTETYQNDGDDESQLLDRIKQFVSYGAETPVEEITEAEDMGDSEVVVYNGKLGIVVDADTGADNEYEVMFADGTEIISGTDLEPATQAQINASKDIVKYIGDDAQFEGRYGVIIEEDGDEYHVAFSDGETWIVGSDLEAPALQESFANDYQMNEPAQTNYMTHGISGGLNSLRRSQATGNVTRISTMESKGKRRKMLKESKQAVGKPSDELASMANLVEAISVQQRIKFGA